MSTNKRTARISQALSEMRQAVRADVAKRCVLHLRVDESSILELYDVAAHKKQPVGTMMREWILERLAQERGGASVDKLHDIERRLTALESRTPAATARRRAKA